MNVSGVWMRQRDRQTDRQTDRQLLLASRNHESAGIIFMDIYKQMSIGKIKTKQSALLSLQPFQLQFEVIV